MTLFAPLTRSVAIVVVGLVASACGPASTGRTRESLVLPEARALQVVREACDDAGVASGEAFAAQFSVEGSDRDVQVDLRVGTPGEAPRFGVEWVSDDDRVRGDVFPPPPPNQLRIVVARSGAQVLVLDAEAYRYEESRQRIQAGAAGATDVDARLRRDLRDFLVYAGLR
ncbi:MAG: hypothetical protein AAF411_17465 [Myxococcota bacterium]